MELKKILTCVFAVLFVLLLKPGAKAQERNLRVSLSGGGSFLKGERAFIIGGDGFGSQSLNGGRFRVGITSDFSEQWAAEFNYGFGHNKLRITEFDSLLVPDIRDFELTVHQLGINGFRYFLDPESRFRPFATAGIGLTRFSPTDQAKVIALAVDFTNDQAVLESSNKFHFFPGRRCRGEASRDLWGTVDFEGLYQWVPSPGSARDRHAAWDGLLSRLGDGKQH